MRKSLIVFCLLLLCGGGFLAGTAGAVGSRQDRIAVTETTLAGDPAAAEGLSVEVSLEMESQLFWTTVFAAGADPVPETEFQFYQERQTTPLYGRTDTVELYVEQGGGYVVSGQMDLAEWEAEDRSDGLLLKPAMDVAGRTPAGESRTEVVQLNDYYAYYPLYLQLSLYTTLEIPEVAGVQLEQLSDCLRIPVPDSELVEVTVQKNAEGVVCYVESNSYTAEDAQSSVLYGSGVACENAVYLLLCGNANFSQLRDGYGVYRIPIEYVTALEASYDQVSGLCFSEPTAHLRMDRMENIFPLDPACSQEVTLQQGLDAEELLLLAPENGQVVLTVLDAGTGAVRQSVTLDTAACPRVWLHGELLILGCSLYTPEARLQVFRREDGRYVPWLETAFYPLNNENRYYQPAFAFDGRRLAIAAQRQYYWGGSHRLTVYDQDGLCYAGDYAFSCDSLPEPPANWDSDRVLQLRWE